MEGIAGVFCAVVLVILSAVSAATVLITGGKPSAKSIARVASPTVFDNRSRHVQITFVADNPWFNRGETVVGMLTRRDSRNFDFATDSDPNASYIIPDDPAQVQIEVLPKI